MRIKLNTLFFLSVLFFISCQESKNNLDNESVGYFSLTFVDSVTYLLPKTFQYNSPFTQIFYDHKSQKEYVCFGNDYATDNLYFFDLIKGGDPVQITSFSKVSQDVKGVKVISLDSIFTVTRQGFNISLFNGKGEVLVSRDFDHLVTNPKLDNTGPSHIEYDATNSKIFFSAEIHDWDYSEKNRFIAKKKYNNGRLKYPNIYAISNVFGDTLKQYFYTPNFYSRFIDTNETFFPIPIFTVIDSLLFITSAYSDSLYVLNHTLLEQKIRAYPLSSHFFETIKSIPAPFYKEEHAYSKEYLSSRSNGYHLWKLTYSSQLNCYVININSKATKYNESGNSSEVSPYYSTLFYDTAFNKLGEIKFKNKSIMTVGRENVVIFKHSDENAPNYDPRKIKMEVYTISKN